MSQLNDDLLVKIFQLLPLQKRIWMEKICRHWKNDVVPKSLRNVTSLDMEDFYRKWEIWRSDVNPHLTGYHILESIIDRVGDQLESVNFPGINSENCRFGIRELKLLSSKCPNLKFLDLGDAHTTSKALLRLGTKLSRLESLSYSPDDFRGSDEDFRQADQNLSVAVESMPQLKHLRVEGNFYGTFLRHLPNSVVSISIHVDGGKNIQLDVAHLAVFLRDHSELKKFEISQVYNGADSEQKLRETIGLLAQHCSQLEYLSVKSAGGQSVEGSLADAFLSLPELKKVEFDRFKLFNLAALASLCVNCTNVEDLSMTIDKPKKFGSDAVIHIGKLNKLKRLKMNLPIDGYTAVMWTGIGVTLEYLDIRNAQVNDDSLLKVGLNCSCLAHLLMTKEQNELITIDGLKSFIQAIARWQSWNDPLKNRHLRIDVYRHSDNSQWPTGINLVQFRDKVKIYAADEGNFGPTTFTLVTV